MLYLVSSKQKLEFVFSLVYKFYNKTYVFFKVLVYNSEYTNFESDILERIKSGISQPFSKGET